MASEELASKPDETEDAETELCLSLMSSDEIDRNSPEIFAQTSNAIIDQSSVSKDYLTLDDHDHQYIQYLSSLPLPSILAKVKELHDAAYQLGLEEAREMTRAKYLNIFNNKKKK